RNVLRPRLIQEWLVIVGRGPGGIFQHAVTRADGERRSVEDQDRREQVLGGRNRSRETWSGRFSVLAWISPCVLRGHESTTQKQRAQTKKLSHLSSFRAGRCSEFQVEPSGSLNHGLVSGAPHSSSLRSGRKGCGQRPYRWCP